MIVPTIGIIPGNHNCGLVPLLGLLQQVDDVDDKRLLVQRTRVTRVTILEARSFQVADCRKISGLDCVEEVVDVVLMVCFPVVPDLSDRSRTRVSSIGGRSVVLKWLMMWNVVDVGHASDRRLGAALAARGPIGIG